MPLQQTSGAASYDAFGGGAPVAAKYIEDFFQTWLRTGTGSSTTVTTGLNASINKSLVWTKSRSAATNHKLTDTARGVTKALSSNTTGAEVTDSQGLTAFSSTGYTIGTNTDYNNSGATYVDWQWVATPKFFDVVTYTGNGVAGREIPHSLGSAPGTIIVKSTDNAVGWAVYHRSLGATKYLTLNLTDAEATNPNYWNDTEPTSTNFTVAGTFPTNRSGYTYVAYLFAHNAGGFGLTGTDNVISCGSFTTSAGGGDATVNLGYEPQWLLVKSSSGTSGWDLIDNMRGMPNLGGFGSAVGLEANNANAEGSRNPNCFPTATGFYYARAASTTYIYIAIRRGPMKVPTTGTSVFDPEVATDTEGQGVVKTTNFPVDLQITKSRASSGSNFVADRLRGVSTNTTDSARVLITNNTDAETSGLAITRAWNNTGFQISSAIGNSSQVYWNFRRAPGFFDVVCYTGTGATGQAINHNLGVVPEFYLIKRRDTSGGADDWQVYCSYLSVPLNSYLRLYSADANGTNTGAWQAPTATQIKIGAGLAGYSNASGGTYVAYLFASCPGVSKVGSYTGNGSSQTINCGFTGGARFVMVKRTDSTGNWMVVDTARGLVSAGDPTLYLNSTAAEVTGVDWLDPDSSGFIVNQEGTMNANVSSATYIYLAIA